MAMTATERKRRQRQRSTAKLFQMEITETERHSIAQAANRMGYDDQTEYLLDLVYADLKRPAVRACSYPECNCPFDKPANGKCLKGYEEIAVTCHEYSQGVCADGAAILKDGQPMTVEEIVLELKQGQAASCESADAVAWGSKPNKPGRYLVRGFDSAGTEAMVHVAFDDGELVCNLHDSNSTEVRLYSSLLSEISDKFEWCELHTTPTPGAGKDYDPVDDPLFQGPDVTVEQALDAMEDERRLNEEHLGGDTKPQEAEPQPELPGLTSSIINDCSWAFVEAMPHRLPGPIFNDLKPAIYEAIRRYEAARATDAEPVAWNDAGVDPIVSKLYRKFKEWSQRGFTAEDVTWCEVRGYVAELLNTTPPTTGTGVFPEGYVLAPKSMCITQEDVGLIVMMTGWDDEDQDDAEGVLWFGLIEDDDGNRTHGLNISCSECMEEGAIQLVQFDEPNVSPPADKPEGECGHD